MYIVKLTNDQKTTKIHGEQEKLKSGSVVKGINAIDSFSFSLLPSNIGFDKIHDLLTLVSVYNTNKDRYEFLGRVLYSSGTMDESGLIVKDVVCESYFGFLCDSQQSYVEEKNWAVKDLFTHIITEHNSQVEEYKRMQIGEITVTDPNDNLYLGIQRESTWKTIEDKLINTLGGEIRFRVVDGVIFIDYLTEIGAISKTKIALAKNMKSIMRERDPSSCISRLIPYGCKLKDENEEETETRLDISSVNNGVLYIENEAAKELYGIRYGIVMFDDVTDASNLLRKGQEYLEANAKIPTKYTVSALDLSLLGLDIDDLDVHNYHPIVNPLLGIDDVARIIKKKIDVCDDTKSTIEIGDNFKTTSDIQRETVVELQSTSQIVKSIEKKPADLQMQINQINKRLTDMNTNLNESFTSKIEQLSDSISLKIDGSLGSKASIVLSAGDNEYTGEIDLTKIRQAFADDPTAISISAGTITFNAGTLIINSQYFTLDSEGYVTATGGTIGGWTLSDYKLFGGDGVNTKTVVIEAPGNETTYVFAAGGFSHDDYGDCPFRVTKDGKLYATDAVVYGDIITIDGSFMTELDKGSLRLYYDDVLCGTINTKYWTGASTEGISLRIEEGGNYIMFSHPSDAGTGYDVDYYLNYGWSSNYDEKHIFQTSARFLSDVYFDGRTDIGSLVLRGPGGKRYLVTAYDGVLECSEI